MNEINSAKKLIYCASAVNWFVWWLMEFMQWVSEWVIAVAMPHSINHLIYFIKNKTAIEQSMNETSRSVANGVQWIEARAAASTSESKMSEARVKGVIRSFNVTQWVIACAMSFTPFTLILLFNSAKQFTHQFMGGNELIESECCSAYYRK